MLFPKICEDFIDGTSAPLCDILAPLPDHGFMDICPQRLCRGAAGKIQPTEPRPRFYR